MKDVRLNDVVVFKRLANWPDEAGHTDETDPDNWQIIISRRADCNQVASAESATPQQQQESTSWTVVCRGDPESREVSFKDRIEFTKHGVERVLNISGIKTIQDVPHYIEFTGIES